MSKILTQSKMIPDWRKNAPKGVALSAARGNNPQDGGGAMLRAPDAATPTGDKMTPFGSMGDLSRWISPAAQQRWLGPGIAYYTPQFVEQIFRQALSGDLQTEWELFDMMKSTSPRLIKNINQVIDKVIAAGFKTVPFKMPGVENPSDRAAASAALVDEALRTMAPRADFDENDFKGTCRDLLDAKMNAHSILETSWEVRQRADGSMMTAPRATRWVHPAWYGYEKGPGDGQVKLKAFNWAGLDSPNLIYGRPNGFEDFPENKFIIGKAKNKTGHPLGSAKLHTLAFSWAACNFSQEWLLNLAQLFGQPFRWALYDTNMPPGDQLSLKSMLQNMGSAAWGMFPAGTQLEFKEAMQRATDTPQMALINYYDRLCDIAVLGQTLTSEVTEAGGARATGEVHERILDDVGQGYADWLYDTLQQLVRSICILNYDDIAECPSLTPPIEEEDESKEVADLLKVLSDADFEPADEAIPELSARIGFKVQRKAASSPDPHEGDDEDDDADAKLTAKEKTEKRLRELLAKYLPQSMDPVDELAAKQAPAVAAAMKESFAPVLAIIRDSKSSAEASQRIRAHFADWRPGQIVAALEPALQQAAALGAIAAKENK